MEQKGVDDHALEVDKLWCFESEFSFDALEQPSSDIQIGNKPYDQDASIVDSSLALDSYRALLNVSERSKERQSSFLNSPAAAAAPTEFFQQPECSEQQPLTDHAFLNFNSEAQWGAEALLSSKVPESQNVYTEQLPTENFIYSAPFPVAYDEYLLYDLRQERAVSKVVAATSAHPVLGESNAQLHPWWVTHDGTSYGEEPCSSLFNEQNIDFARLSGSFDCLAQHIATLKHQLQLHFYTQDMHRLKLLYWKLERDFANDYFKLQRYSPKSLQHMSLFTDANGRPPPSTPEGIQKAEEKLRLPLYRKKYDWNLQLWTDQDQKRLYQLVASQIVTDLIKLKVEAKLYAGDIEQRCVVEHLLEERRQLFLDDPPSSEDTRRTLELLNEELKRKVDRVLAPNPLVNELLVLSPDTPGGVQSNASVTNLEVLCPGTKTRRFYPDVLQQHRADDVEVYTCVLNAYWRKFWDNIALMMESRLELSGRDCQIQWEHHLSPRVNLSAFTTEEDQLLCDLASSYHQRNWDAVAEALGTRRTAYQCFERYQRHLNKTLQRCDWTKEEDSELMSAVEEMGHEISGPSRWSRVALRLPGRSNLQCRSRYLYSLKANLKQGNWNLDEDLLLQLLVYAYGGGRWSKIVRHMAGRTDMKCRERFERVLKPALDQVIRRRNALTKPFSGTSAASDVILTGAASGILQLEDPIEAAYAWLLHSVIQTAPTQHTFNETGGIQEHRVKLFLLAFEKSGALDQEIVRKDVSLSDEQRPASVAYRCDPPFWNELKLVAEKRKLQTVTHTLDQHTGQQANSGVDAVWESGSDMCDALTGPVSDVSCTVEDLSQHQPFPHTTSVPQSEAQPNSLSSVNAIIFFKCKLLAAIHRLLTLTINTLISESQTPEYHVLLSRVLRQKEKDIHLSKDFFRTASLTSHDEHRISGYLKRLLENLSKPQRHNS